MAQYPPPPPPPGWPPVPPGPPGGQYPPPGYGYGYGYQPPTLAARWGLQYATFGQRLGALIIDGLVLMAIALPAVLVGVVLAVANWDTRLGTCTDTDTGRRYTCDVPTGRAIAFIALAVVLYLVTTIVGGILYWGKLEGQRTQTVGKKALGIRTLRASTGQPLGFGRAVGRMFARYISGQVCELGYLWSIWDKDKQTWHDKIVDSIVVKA